MMQAFLIAAILAVCQAQMDPTWLRTSGPAPIVRTRPTGTFPATANSTRWDPLPGSAGPFLRFSGRKGDVLTYSVLILVAAEPVGALKGTVLRVSPSNPVGITTSKPAVIFSFGGYTFIRWVLNIDVTNQNRATHLHYEVRAAQGLFSPRVNKFVIPGSTQPWSYSYNSCNGFHNLSDAPVGGIEPLWADIISLQPTRPLHLIIADGDQIYNDAVLEDIEELAEVANTTDFRKVLAFKWNDELKNKTHYWYMSHYIYHWSVISESYTKALATIPFIMSWDDHEIFNGFGSWPDFLQNSEFFTGSMSIAKVWYLIFQHHSGPTADLLMEDLKWNSGVSGGLNWFSMLDPYTAILLPDLRSERTQYQVLSNSTNSAIVDKISKDAAPTLAHLIVASSNPLIYAIEKGVEGFFFVPTGLIDLKPFGLTNTMRDLQLATLNPAGAPLVAGLKSVLGMTFGILDFSDIFDNWDSRLHLEERAAMVNALQGWGAERKNKTRITFLGGDSHLAYSGKFYNPNFVGKIENDPHWSLVVTASAIGNNPASSLAGALEVAAAAYSEYLDPTNRTKVVQNPVYSLAVPVAFPSGPVNYIVPARNYLRGQLDIKTGNMMFEHRFEVVDPNPPPSNTTGRKLNQVTSTGLMPPAPAFSTYSVPPSNPSSVGSESRCMADDTC